jgi:beta-xylosidase/alpha-L-arabinofuranosidase
MQGAGRSGSTRVRWIVVGAACASLAAATTRADGPATLEVDVGKPGVTVPASFFGLMTEEINHSYDGGLFAELIQNRTFQDQWPRQGGRDQPSSAGGMPIHWSIVGSGKVAIDLADPVNAALPVSMRLDLAGGESGVANDGYWGIPVRPDTAFTASFYARGSGGFAGPVTASIRIDKGDVTVATGMTQSVTAAWQKYTVRLRTAHDAPTTSNARFVLSASGPGSVSFSLVSLFPPTYRDTPNGLRPDLMKLLAELKPKFIRLPGGNYVEGSRFADRFNWKQMIGPAEQRPGHQGCWGYRSSDGFGVPEYLLWCKQLGAEPVLCLFAGYVLNGDHFKAGSPEMAVYTREALEEIEYVSGPADSEWGRKRAADGFPEPFPLHYVEIGNEDWFDRSGSYDGRFAQMARAIRDRYPQLKIIATAPVKSFKPDLYDDHFYRDARQLMRMATMYDPPTGPARPLAFSGGGWNGRQRDGTQTFVGEWATQEGRPTPTLNAALADAAFVMGLEKNSDAVVMECYAPLLVNVSPADPGKGYPKAWQWGTNLIGYDAVRSFGSPSYYAQVMLAQNKGDVVLPTRLDVPGKDSGMVFASSTYDKAEGSVILKVVNGGNTPVTTNISLRGVGPVEPTGRAIVLAGDPTAVNTLDEPRKVAPKEETIAGTSASFPHTFPPHSLTILRLKTSPSAPEAQTSARNPIIWADVPDLAVIRVGDTYYMSSTTMHMSPGLPIMKSSDLVNWRLVSYAYDTLGDNDALTLRNGKNAYGKGSWASSLRYHDGTFYVSTFSSTTGKTHVYRTTDPEKGPWQETSFRPALHDHSLFFDDDGRVYMIHGSGDIRLTELTGDVSGIKPGGVNQVIVPNASLVAGPRGGLPAEGSQMLKRNGKYYLSNITWPPRGMRTQLVFRADALTGPYEGKVALKDQGVAQGGLIDTPGGNWYALLFQDHGAVGRTPFLVPLTWKDGWPVMGSGGKVPTTLEIPAGACGHSDIVTSDDFDRRSGDPALPLAWQWNHNPDNALWSLTRRPGFLRLTTGRVDANLVGARNTLTQRTFGPECSGTVSLDVSHMNDGDMAGLAAFQKRYGFVGVKMTGDTRSIVMVSAESGLAVELETLPLSQTNVFLRVDCDFKNRADKARFLYSLDGRAWTAIGKPLQMAYTLPHFMGYRFALFNFATKTPGGFVDFDYFRVGDRPSRTD